MGWIKGLCCILVGLGVLSSVYCQTDDESNQFYLIRPEARSRVKHGDNLTYMFSITLNMSSPADYLSILVNGSNIKVLDITDLLETNTTWQAEDGRTVVMNTPGVEVEVVKESQLHPVSDIHLQFQIVVGDLKLKTISGQMELHVADTAPLGSILRPMMYIFLFLEHRVFAQSRIIGDYVFVELPEVKALLPEPRALDMKEKAHFMSCVHLPATPLQPSFLNVYMPRNMSTPYAEEPYLTVRDFQFVGYTGFPVDSSRLNSDSNTVYLSSSKTSEIDGIVFAISGLNESNTALNVSLELDFLMEVEGLDFMDSEHGMATEVVYILETGDHFFIIGNSTLFVNRSLDVERAPKLDFTIDRTETITEQKQTTTEYQLRVLHEANTSWSSAYNVSVIIYLPPFLHGFKMLRTKDLVKTNTAVENIIGENCIQFTMQRISLAHTVRLQFSLILDTDHTQYKQGEEFLVLAEASYTGWRNHTYLGTGDIKSFPITFNITKEDEITPLCECNEVMFTQCRCTKLNRCNGIIDNVSCVDCNYPWHCVRTLNGFGMTSVLSDASGISYNCPAARRYRNAGRCTQKHVNGTIKRLRPIISTILGLDKENGCLYGISQNGLAYIISMDTGITWYSVHPKIYARAKRSSTFVMATLK